MSSIHYIATTEEAQLVVSEKGLECFKYVEDNGTKTPMGIFSLTPYEAKRILVALVDALDLTEEIRGF